MPLNALFGNIIKKRIEAIGDIRSNPFQEQNRVYQYLISQLAHTTYGKSFGVSEGMSYAKFQEQLPLTDYDDVKPYVERLQQGERNLLWPGRTKWFAKSSGTTSDRSKFIPVTKESLQENHFRGGKDLLSVYYNSIPEVDLYSGKHLVLGGSAEVNKHSLFSYSGDLSAILVKNLPIWAEIRRTPSRQTALMSDWKEKLEALANETLKEDVRILAGVPSWTLVLAQRVLEITGKENLREVWPNLELFMHGGVNFDPYRSEFKKLIPFDDMNYLESYNASEGYFGLQDRIEEEGLLLLLNHGIFFEFIPMNEFKGKDSKAIPLEEVELGKNYALVISTLGGLWRYIVGDTIIFTEEKPFRFKVSGRTKHFINVFGEEVVVENAERAVSKTVELLNVTIRDFTVAPVYSENGNPGRHQWMMEFTNPPRDIEEFRKVLDDNLRAINSDYDAKRQTDLNLSMLELIQCPTGTFDKWLDGKGKLGGQHKIPRLANDRSIAEEILELL